MRIAAIASDSSRRLRVAITLQGSRGRSRSTSDQAQDHLPNRPCRMGLQSVRHFHCRTPRQLGWFASCARRNSRRTVLFQGRRLQFWLQVAKDWRLGCKNESNPQPKRDAVSRLTVLIRIRDGRYMKRCPPRAAPTIDVKVSIEPAGVVLLWH